MNFIFATLFDPIVSKIDKLSSRVNNRDHEKRLLLLESLISDIHEHLNIEKRHCPICQNEIMAFHPFGEKLRPNALCPSCGSLERHRMAYLYFKEQTDLFKRDNVKLLHVAPEKIFYDIFSASRNIDYLPVDINPSKPIVKEKVDIQNIQYEDNLFDVIYCSHVLEHVSDDTKAMMELNRVLKPEGWAILQVPIRYDLEVTLENPAYSTPALRTKYYGQHDHLRAYGLDYKNKLERAGFKLRVNAYSDNFTLQQKNKYGLPNKENIYFCTK